MPANSNGGGSPTDAGCRRLRRIVFPSKYSTFAYRAPSSFATKLDYSQYPSFNLGDTSFFPRQVRAEESAQRIAAVRTLQPCSRCVGSLLVAVPVLPREPARPERWVDLGHDRLVLGNLPSIKRPEVGGALALLPEVEKPRKPSVRRGCDLALNAEAEDGLRGGRPSFCQPEPASLPSPPKPRPVGSSLMKHT